MFKHIICYAFQELKAADYSSSPTALLRGKTGVFYVNARNGQFLGLFKIFCDVATLAAIHKRKEPNLTTG
jgi:hypothetical protein